MTVISIRGAGVKRQVGSDPHERGEREVDDFYRTGEVGTRALLAVERFPGSVWEPACGTGDMSVVLEGAAGRRAGIQRVVSTDLVDRGFGTGGVNFFAPRSYMVVSGGVNHVITNPPFKHVEAFARRGLEVASGKVALIARLQWLEGQGRANGLFRECPPARVWVFPYRCPMARWPLTMRSGLVAFAWYVWDADHGGPTQLGWLPGPRFDD